MASNQKIGHCEKSPLTRGGVYCFDTNVSKCNTQNATGEPKTTTEIVFGSPFFERKPLERASGRPPRRLGGQLSKVL